jgi:cysteine-rich repeat protein
VCPFVSDMDVFKNGTPECAYVRAGTCGDNSERGFLGARVALERFMAGTGCEPVPGGECSLRPGARLAVIFMTDTGEQTLSRSAPPGQPDNSVASWVNYFSDFDLTTAGAQRAQVHGLLCPGRPTHGNPDPCSDTLEDPALFDRYSDVIASLGGFEGSIRNDDQSQLANTITQIVDAAIAGACCGDGEVEAGEECDDGNLNDGDCCSSTCHFAPSTTVCRPAAGACDLAEFCTGSSGSCPPNAYKPTTAECRAAIGPCDVAENCTGSSAVCPADVLNAATATCRAAAGPCDMADTCSGTHAACPTDRKSTAICRAAHDVCDAVETCDGHSNDCPADVAAPNGTSCHDGNACTLDDTCSGFTCIPGAPKTCDAPDTCHAAGTCNPTTGECSNPPMADGTPCSDGDVCTQTDLCASGSCVGADPLPCADDGDACTMDFCEPLWGCMHKPLAGMEELSCLCTQGLTAPACGGQRIPDGASWRFKRACMLIARAATAKPNKAHKLIAKAGRKLRKAVKVATEAARTGQLTAECGSAVGGTLGTVQTQVREVFP